MESDELKKLIEIAKTPAKKRDAIYPDEASNREHVRLFIQEKSIKPGSIVVVKSAIYRHYLAWAKESALAYRDFFKEFEYFFKKQTKTKNAYFKLRRHCDRTKEKKERPKLKREE